MLIDIGHPVRAAASRSTTSPSRTCRPASAPRYLFRLANFHNAHRLGTGDLSELALGWCTYGVGDHMSHYNVNASVPKTLIQHLIRWVAEPRRVRRRDASTMLQLDPRDRDLARAGAAGDGDEPAQSTEAGIGPYELQDFNLYYITPLRLPSEQGRLPGAGTPGATPRRGEWPACMPDSDKHVVRPATIKHWLRGLPLPLLPDQPVQALGGAERPEGRLRRLALAARRLARAERLRGRRLACGTRRWRSR